MNIIVMSTCIFAALACALMISVVVRTGPLLRELADHNSKLLGALIMLEWSSEGFCPFCGNPRIEGHADGCKYREIFFMLKGYYGKKTIA